MCEKQPVLNSSHSLSAFMSIDNISIKLTHYHWLQAVLKPVIGLASLFVVVILCLFYLNFASKVTLLFVAIYNAHRHV